MLGIAVIVVGVVGRSYVQDQVGKEKIVGSDDMTPEGVKPGIEKAGLQDVSVSSCSVAGEEVDTGKEAKCFADYMRIHTLEGTGGKTYAEMPQDSPERDIWVTRPRSRQRYTSYFAENVAPSLDHRRDRDAARRHRLHRAHHLHAQKHTGCRRAGDATGRCGRLTTTTAEARGLAGVGWQRRRLALYTVRRDAAKKLQKRRAQCAYNAERPERHSERIYLRATPTEIDALDLLVLRWGASRSKILKVVGHRRGVGRV